MQVHAYKCFGRTQGQGNTALVIEGHTGDADARQAVATAYAQSACVFIDRGEGGAPDSVDYFYPHMRSPLCLHATLAAAQRLFTLRADDRPFTVSTALRGQPLQLSRQGELIYIGLSAQSTPSIPLDAVSVAGLLGDPGMPLPSTPRLASVGSPKLLVEVADTATLFALRPHLAGIVGWGRENGINGIYAYTRLGEGNYAGRNFNHLDPALEDSATGVAAGALTALLQHGLTLQQGDTTGQPCLIRTHIESGLIWVGGTAVPA